MVNDFLINIYKYAINVNETIIFVGFMYGVDAIKSVILTLAAAERIISIEEAVKQSRLEENYQVCITICILKSLQPICFSAECYFTFCCRFLIGVL